MIEFIDKTSTVSGTPINRANLMAIQGFIAQDIVFNSDGSIVKTNELGQTLTIKRNEDNTITETFVGDKTIVKTISFDNGQIKVVIS